MTCIHPNDEWRVDPAPKRDLSGVHDSDECSCEQCIAADEYEAREARKVAEAGSGAKNVSTASGIAEMAPSDSGTAPLWAGRETIRAAILDVIDAGAPSGWWELYDDGDNPEVTEDIVNKERCDFVDAVIARILELQQPPFNFPRLEQFCDRHKRSRLPVFKGECSDCRREREVTGG